MTILEALRNARELLEAQGFTSGDIHDDLSLAISRLAAKYPDVAKEEL
jgi:hypothetical protein